MKQVILICVLAILSGCVTALPPGAAPISSLSDAEAKQSKIATEKGYRHISNDTNIRLISALPGKLGNWSEEPGHYVNNYETHYHGLGYSKRYNEGPRRPVWADVYFFHARQTGMSDGIESKQFVSMWRQTISEISFKYDVKDKTDRFEIFHDMKFRKCRFTIISGERKLESLMYLTVFEGTFLKVRITYRPDYKDAQTEIDNFMNDLAGSLTKWKI